MSLEVLGKLHAMIIMICINMCCSMLSSTVENSLHGFLWFVMELNDLICVLAGSMNFLVVYLAKVLTLGGRDRPIFLLLFLFLSFSFSRFLKALELF